jgi:hypothetical protein
MTEYDLVFVYGNDIYICEYLNDAEYMHEDLQLTLNALPGNEYEHFHYNNLDFDELNYILENGGYVEFKFFDTKRIEITINRFDDED